MKQKNIHNGNNFSAYKQVINSQRRKNIFEVKGEYHQFNLLKRRYKSVGKGKRKIFTNSNEKVTINKKNKFGSKLSIK